MARGARIVDEFGIVRDCDDLYIAYDGKSEYVAQGFVNKEGTVRQFWPKTEVVNENGIVLVEGTYESYWKAEFTGTARAICYYAAQTGQIVLSDPEGEVESQWTTVNVINPPPRSQGVYLYKVDIISGDVQSNDPIGVWTDVNIEGTIGELGYWVEQEGSGSATGTIEVSFAEDDGLGAPVISTIKTMTVNFLAEVDGARIIMSTQPWDLNNVEVNETAEVWILTIPQNWYSEITQQYSPVALVNGEYGFPKGVQKSEIYASPWNPSITVQVDQISGDPVWSPEGWELGVPYTTDIRRRWKIEAASPGEVVNAVVNITITDGLETVTKQVTMRAEQVEETTDPGSSISTDFTRRDYAYDEEISSCLPGSPTRSAEIGLYVYPNGTIDVTTSHTPDPTGFPQNWNDAAPAVPDPENYECIIQVDMSDELWPDTTRSTSGWFNNWKNLSSTVQYIAYTSSAGGSCGTVTQEATWLLGIREVGRPSTVKWKYLDLKTVLKGTS